MSRKRKEVTFNQIFLWSSFLMIVYLFFQNFHWINILWSLFVVLVIVPTVYYLINERSFKALSYQKNSEFSGYLILFVLLSVVFVILMTVIISAFAPSLL